MLNTFQYRFRVSAPVLKLVQDHSGLIYIDSEIPALPAGRGDSERDAETEGPEFSSGSIQHDIFQDLVQPPMLPCR